MAIDRHGNFSRSQRHPYAAAVRSQTVKEQSGPLVLEGRERLICSPLVQQQLDEAIEDTVGALEVRNAQCRLGSELRSLTFHLRDAPPKVSLRGGGVTRFEESFAPHQVSAGQMHSPAIVLPRSHGRGECRNGAVAS